MIDVKVNDGNEFAGIVEVNIRDEIAGIVEDGFERSLRNFGGSRIGGGCGGGDGGG